MLSGRACMDTLGNSWELTEGTLSIIGTYCFNLEVHPVEVPAAVPSPDVELATAGGRRSWSQPNTFVASSGYDDIVSTCCLPE